MAKRKVKPLGMGYECLLPPYQRREVTALEVMQAIDVLMNAGFTVEGLSVLSHLFKNVPKELGGWAWAVQRRYEESRHG